MNLKAITSALLIAGLAASPAFASNGTITFTGSVANVTCSINKDAGGPDFTVDLGGVSAGDFKAVGDTLGKTGFRIRIGAPGETSCPNGTKVWAHFDADSTFVDPFTGMVKLTSGAGVATGVQIRLYTQNDEKIDAWTNSAVVKQTVADNQAVIVHSVAYERIGDVTAGRANGQVRYTINYEPGA